MGKFHIFTQILQGNALFSGKIYTAGRDGRDKGAGTFHSPGQSKEGSVGFGTSQHPIFMNLLPDHLWHEI